MRPRIALNALALRPGGSGVQTYIRELTRELPAVVDAEVVALVQADVVDELPESVTARPFPVVRGLRRAVAGMRPVHDVALVHGLDVTLPVGRSVPRVVTFHDLAVFDVPWAFGRAAGTAKRALARRSARVADALVAVSPFTAERVRARFGREATVTALAAPPDCTPPSDEAVRAVRRHYDLPERFVLHVGTVEPRKDVGGLIAAGRVAGTPVVLAGARPENPAAAGAQALGYVPRADLLAIYGAATVVAYPSRYEGFGLPVVEAMACGAPVVATRVASLSEVGGDAMAFVPVGDVDGLAAVLQELFADDDRRAEMASEGLARVARRRWRDTAAETAAVYRSLGITV